MPASLGCSNELGDIGDTGDEGEFWPFDETIGLLPPAALAAPLSDMNESLDELDVADDLFEGSDPPLANDRKAAAAVSEARGV